MDACERGTHEVMRSVDGDMVDIVPNALECANCKEASTNAGQFLPCGRWVCTEKCRRELCYKQSMGDLAASGGIVDAP